jgi:hypothetical protein
MILANKLPTVLTFRLQGYTHKDDPSRGITLGHPAENGRLAMAGVTPGSPEIYHHYFAA